MKRVDLDKHDKKIRDFIRSLGTNADGAILELEGKPVLKALPVKKSPVNNSRLRAAIRKRRDESRRLMSEWEAVDREMWYRVKE
ncbi:MAG: hypothetical protein L0Y71_19105 [Gemmataceae bacterium]|nr:hypothetical protein [Gemmataceae bacterium]